LEKENSDSKPGKVVSLSADKFHLGEGEISDSKLTAKEGKLKENRPNANRNQSRRRLKTEVSDPKASPEEPRHHAFTANMTLGYRILKTIMVLAL
jgi:hypothetical protein